MWVKSEQLKSHNGCIIKTQAFECLIFMSNSFVQNENWNHGELFSLVQLYSKNEKRLS